MDDDSRFIGYLWSEAEPMFSGRSIQVKRTHPPRLDPASFSSWRVIRIRDQAGVVEVLLAPDTDRLQQSGPAD